MSAAPESELSTVKRALIALQTTRARLEALEQAQKEPIAIIGMGCRLPGGVDSPDAFWDLLTQGRDAVAEVPATRWDNARYYDPDYDAPGKIVTREGGFLGEIRDSDPRFFGISPREAASIDPQQHLLLEVAWEALEHAGLVPATLEGSKTGVFVGICNQDYSVLLMNRDPNDIDAYMTTGMAHSVAAGRLAYTLGLQGPCFAIDTACSSSLVAVHLACQSLRNRECDLAITGGVNLILCPETSINFSRNHMLSPDGRCKTFAATADGFGRGEGCGLIVLKRLSDVVPEQDRVLALIRGSAINQDGATSGLTVPNGPAQQAVIRAALDNGGIRPEQVSYIEAHGTGTALGDPIEIGALHAVFGTTRPADKPLLVGSVKTNLGHLEGAAGISGLMKVVLALKHGEIPPHLHCHTPNPHIPWDELPIAVTRQGQAWPHASEPRRAGVSSFGFSGTNAHVVLEEAPPTTPPEAVTADRPLHILTLSARSPEALAALAGRYADRVTDSVADVCYSANTRRALFEYRLVAIAADADALRFALERHAKGQATSAITHGFVADGEPPRLVWLFTGQGSQYPGMGAGLYRSQPVFRAAIDTCAEILDPLLNRSLVSLLFEDGADLNETAYTQPALFALEYALAQLWLSWGVKPDAVAGHSVGEYVAACVAGVFSLEDGLRLIAARGRLMQALPRNGAMVAVFANRERVEQAMTALDLSAKVAIAAVNSGSETVISGEREAVRELTDHLTQTGTQCRDLAVSHAFHSALMMPMLADFEREVRRISLAAPRIRLISNLTGTTITQDITDPGYWVRHVRQPVLFAAGIAAMRQQGITAFLEIGPHPVLSRLVRAEAPSPDTGLYLASLRKDQPEWETLTASLSALHLAGITVDWQGFDRPYARRLVELPTYPFQRKRHWYTHSDRPEQRTSANNSALLALLQTGETQALTRYLADAGDFTAEEAALLPKLAEHLIRRHRQPETTGDNWCYLPVWREQARAADPISLADDGAWLLFANDDAAELTANLSATGRRVVLVLPGTGYERIDTDTWQIAADHEADYQRLCAELTAETPLQGVVHVWPSAAMIDPVAELLRIIRLARALARLDTPPRLWLLTQNAIPVADAAPTSPFPWLAWGLGRSLFLEYPNLKGGLIDATPGADLATELVDSEGEDALALRDGKRYVTRLVPAAPTTKPAPRLKADSSYLITGGLGALGLKTARWLAEQGAGHLVLLGRRGADGAAQASLELLRSKGTRITVEQADAADTDALGAVIARIAASGYPLKGVIHAAGVLSSQSVDSLDADSLARVLAPKVQGGWNLHRLTEGLELDFFVCFSSISAVLGTALEAHYTAANAFLDGLAEYRHSLGLPAHSVAWGPWQGENMIGADAARRIAASGFQALPATESLSLMGRVLGSNYTRIAVVDADWSRLKNLYEARTRQPLLAELGDAAAPAAETGISAALKELRAVGVRDRLDALVAYVQQQLSTVLKFDPETPPDPRQGFFDLGLDSLTAVELKNRLEAELACPLPPSLAFDYPNVEALAGYLLGRLFAVDTAPATPAAPTPEAAPNADAIRQLSDAELAALIDDEFAALTD